MIYYCEHTGCRRKATVEVVYEHLTHFSILYTCDKHLPWARDFYRKDAGKITENPIPTQTRLICSNGGVYKPRLRPDKIDISIGVPTDWWIGFYYEPNNKRIFIGLIPFLLVIVITLKDTNPDYLDIHFGS